MLKNKITIWISVCYIAVTVGINLYGYFHLPEIIATQFSVLGREPNHMPTPIYLMGVFILITVISLLTIYKSEVQRLKYLLINSILVFANIAMIVSQL